VLEKSFKVLEFSFKNSRPLKVLENREGFENAWKVLEFYQPVLKIARENNKFAASVLSCLNPKNVATASCEQFLFAFFMRPVMLMKGMLLQSYHSLIFAKPVLFQTANFSAGKAWWNPWILVWNSVWTLSLATFYMDSQTPVVVDLLLYLVARHRAASLISPQPRRVHRLGRRHAVAYNCHCAIVLLSSSTTAHCATMFATTSPANTCQSPNRQQSRLLLQYWSVSPVTSWVDFSPSSTPLPDSSSRRGDPNTSRRCSAIFTCCGSRSVYGFVSVFRRTAVWTAQLHPTSPRASVG